MKKKINELNTLDYAYADYLSAVSLYQTALEQENKIVSNYSGYHLGQAVEKAIKFQMEEAGMPYDRKDVIDYLINQIDESDRKNDIYISDYVRDFSEMFTTWEAKTRYVTGYLLSIKKLETGLNEVKKYLDEVSEKHNKMTKDVEEKPLELVKKGYGMTSKEKKIYTLDELKNGFENIMKNNFYNFVSAIYLFGSYARGEATETSDIDIAVSTYRDPDIKIYKFYDSIKETFGKNADVLTEYEGKKLFGDRFYKERIKIIG